MFRGATCEDLQLSPALVLSDLTSVATALHLAYEREFDVLPVTNSERRLTGYVQVEQLKRALQTGTITESMSLAELSPSKSNRNEKEPLADGTNPFKRFEREKTYRLITPETPLEELDQFFQKESFALITDDKRKFVLGVVTKEDLTKFSTRRNPNGAVQFNPHFY